MSDIKMKGTGEIWYDKRKVVLLVRGAFLGGLLVGSIAGFLLGAFLKLHIAWMP